MNHLTLFLAQTIAYLSIHIFSYPIALHTGAPSDVDLRAETASNNYRSSHQPQASAFILKGISSLNIISLNYGLGIFIVEAMRSRNFASGSSLFRRVSKEPFLLNLPEKQLLREFLEAELILIPTTEIGL